jgi:hypothetical protein
MLHLVSPYPLHLNMNIISYLEHHVVCHFRCSDNVFRYMCANLCSLSEFEFEAPLLYCAVKFVLATKGRCCIGVGVRYALRLHTSTESVSQHHGLRR